MTSYFSPFLSSFAWYCLCDIECPYTLTGVVTFTYRAPPFDVCLLNFSVFGTTRIFCTVPSRLNVLQCSCLLIHVVNLLCACSSLALLAWLTIVGIVVSTIGLFTATGAKLDVMRSMIYVMLVGLSVDYVVRFICDSLPRRWSRRTYETSAQFGFVRILLGFCEDLENFRQSGNKNCHSLHSFQKFIATMWVTKT